MPHVEMIGSLIATVSNLEEQRRLARLAQMILNHTQQILSNMRKFFPA